MLAKSPGLKILLLADATSAHTQKWALGLASVGFEIGVFSLKSPAYDWFSEKNVRVFYQKSFDDNIQDAGEFVKLNYLKSVKYLKEVVSELKPDILHAHYASSYGMLGRKVKYHPYFISVWGSDVLEFPAKSFLHKWFLKRNLRAADKIFATSKTLQLEVLRIFNLESFEIPFGIDTSVFKPHKSENYFEEDAIVIGTIKSLEKHYCVDVLIDAFAKLFLKHGQLKLRLLIVGDGTERKHLEVLADHSGISAYVKFTGKIPFSRIHEYHNKIDIFVNLSEYESFGVSVLEASACEKPLVATDTGGLKEVVMADKTGLLVPVKDVDATAEAIEKLILNENLRHEMGKAGRKFVCENFDFEKCLQKMSDAYYSL